MINLAVARAMANGDDDREREILEEMLDREREEAHESEDEE